MGIVKIEKVNVNPEMKLGVWELKETSQMLISSCHFTNSESESFNKISNERRKCEYLANRLLLQSMLQKKVEIQYDSCGKPFLNENLNISISHSSDLVVILLSEIPIGIDVESITRNTEKVATRFLSEVEQKQITQTSDNAFTRLLYWCAKEAVFKCSPLNEIEFKSQILIQPFQPLPKNGIFYGQLQKDNQLAKFVFRYEILNNNAIVYCMEKS
ncbi:MAG TPA: 4'-phosphopantetheinyl transferase superfamily protein [Mariniphaga sp.]|nr:4'-phosphopantetheinyl transferase superfamily protein [Mariniphaga sp.]